MLKLKEGIDYHIVQKGKSLELQSMTLGGFAAGIVDLTRRSYDINLDTVMNIGLLNTALTIPKKPKKVTKKTTGVTKDKPEKVIGKTKE